MLILLLLFGLFAGMVIPLQTSINSRLGLRLKSPFISSAVSFFVGMVFLFIVSLIAEPYFFSEGARLFSLPLWMLIGGGCIGVVYLTANILLLPHLGSALTVVVTLLGQMIMALAIDQFGWFRVPVHELNGPRLLGILLMLAGVFVVERF
ncbi:DMT family transporter [Sporolactobacillus sp. KGMB 08714]|uniref:DMT family transporter n=1 Tax=Sporolactobacillus sp. KGMB 08714 TaxID=3064704 RepID=UPI002FBE410B